MADERDVMNIEKNLTRHLVIDGIKTEIRYYGNIATITKNDKR